MSLQTERPTIAANGRPNNEGISKEDATQFTPTVADKPQPRYWTDPERPCDHVIIEGEAEPSPPCETGEHDETEVLARWKAGQKPAEATPQHLQPPARPARPSEPIWENLPTALTVRKQWVVWGYVL